MFEQKVRKSILSHLHIKKVADWVASLEPIRGTPSHLFEEDSSILRYCLTKKSFNSW